MYSRRGRSQNRENISDEEREAQLMSNYIDLMTRILTSSSEVTESFNSSMRIILQNCNSLFDNYYQWGRHTSFDNTENLSTPTSRRRHRRSRRNSVINENANANANVNTSTTSVNQFTTESPGFINAYSNNVNRPNRNIISNVDTRPFWNRELDIFQGVNRRRNRRANSRNTRQSPLLNNITNRVVRPPVNLRAGQTNLQTFINNTLHTSFRNYTLTREQINSVLTTSPWREIQPTSDQTVCPITQIPFQQNEMVSRITRCGHIFSANAINNYLLNYDNRCPVCRLNLSNISRTSTDGSFNLQASETQSSTENSRQPIGDNSYLNTASTTNQPTNQSTNQPTTQPTH